MSGFVLRVIAMVTMLIDHIGWNFLNDPMVLTWIGRIAFPVYAFLLADGFLFIFQDRNRLVKHVTVLLILSVVSELGYDLMESKLNFGEYMSSQSNMITLLLGYIGMIASEAMIPFNASETETLSGKQVLALACAYILIGFANYMMKDNYNLVGPWLVVSFYWFLRHQIKNGQTNGGWPWIKRLLFLVLVFACYLPLYFWVRSGFGNAARWWEEVVNYAPWIVGHGIAALILSSYNGELGYHKRWFTRLYTVFYPVHMYLIGIICILIKRY